jgi:hypothetical protein
MVAEDLNEPSYRLTLVAVGLVTAGAVAAFALLVNVLGFERELAVPVAMGFFSIVNPTSKLLRKWELDRQEAPLRQRIPDVGSFYVPTWRLLLVGCLALVGASQGSSALGVLFGALVTGIVAIEFGLVISLLGGIIASLIVGHWVGSRARIQPVLTMLLLAFVSALVAKAPDFLLIPAAEFEAATGDAKTVGLFLTGSLVLSMIFFLFGSVGVWRGRRARSRRYVQYVLELVGEDVRTQLVDLAYEEAIRLSRQTR